MLQAAYRLKFFAGTKKFRDSRGEIRDGEMSGREKHVRTSDLVEKIRKSTG